MAVFMKIKEMLELGYNIGDIRPGAEHSPFADDDFCRQLCQKPQIPSASHHPSHPPKGGAGHLQTQILRILENRELNRLPG